MTKQVNTDELTDEMNTRMSQSGRKIFPTAWQNELIDQGLKRCSSCRLVQPLESFGPNSNNSNGYHHQCRTCSRSNSRDYYKRTSKQSLAAGKAATASPWQQLISEDLTRDPEDPGVLQNWEQSITAELNTRNRKTIPALIKEHLASYGLKRCPTCGVVKLRNEYAQKAASADGLEAQCKHCAVTRSKRRYREDLEKSRAYSRLATAKRRTNPMVRMKEQLDAGFARTIAAGGVAEDVSPEELLAYWESEGIDPLKSVYSGVILTELAGSENPRSIDHHTSISKGGSHTLDNLYPCTRRENEVKSKHHFIGVVGGVKKEGNHHE